MPVCTCTNASLCPASFPWLRTAFEGERPRRGGVGPPRHEPPTPNQPVHFACIRLRPADRTAEFDLNLAFCHAEERRYLCFPSHRAKYAIRRFVLRR